MFYKSLACPTWTQFFSFKSVSQCATNREVIPSMTELWKGALFMTQLEILLRALAAFRKLTPEQQTTYLETLRSLAAGQGQDPAGQS